MAQKVEKRIVFEDLIDKRDLRAECPYCKSWNVVRYGLRQKPISGEYEQEIQCNVCSKMWYVMYNEDMKNPYIKKYSE